MTPEVCNDRHRPALRLDAVCLATNIEPAQENATILGHDGSGFLTPPVVSHSSNNPKRKRQDLNIPECPIAPDKRCRGYVRKLPCKDLRGFSSGSTNFTEDHSSIVAQQQSPPLSRAPSGGTSEDLCVNLSLYFEFEEEDGDNTSTAEHVCDDFLVLQNFLGGREDWGQYVDLDNVESSDHGSPFTGTKFFPHVGG
eukprot:CAMPEP_0206385688 /NCGR_PEP_ID=MMETSP0294-20121207/15440_1 /ASSEMBLY_ACC=CAM_ASM_000327 /TAXON_ID=39354 /ORGANISM="Heterosigma akashiwo, Strain CCMP2393" /LENGTH=195 /DNA_ID=CAMNT_0053836479 /DNA_START=27 /DNA_END=614 /DNA_ORIENTATION=+